MAKPQGVAQLVSRNQKQLGATRVHLIIIIIIIIIVIIIIHRPVLVIVKVSVAAVTREEGVSSVAPWSVKVGVVPMSSFLKPDLNVHLARLLLRELEVGHLLPQVKGLPDDLVHGGLWQLR